MSVVEEIDGSDDALVVLTCEHASNLVPAPWAWPPEDAWITDSHWAWDLGIADVTRALARELRAPAVLAGFSRLLCDVNRPADAPTTFRDRADGRAVELNRGLTDAERSRRLAALYAPYHAAVDAAVRRHPRAHAVLSMHSFTRVYESGPPRPMELGVLFDREELVSHAIAASLTGDGWKVALNEPYSGKDGLIYSAERHAGAHGRRALELEVRNDVASDADRRAALVGSVRRAVERGLSAAS